MLLIALLHINILWCPLTRLPASCDEVKACVRVLGPKRAEAVARRKGASDFQIEQAKECLRATDNGGK